MAFITWDDSCKVNVATMDSQHRTLVDMLNRLHEAMSQGKGKTVMDGILNELVDYATKHFSAEEQLMNQHGFPQLGEQKVAHVSFGQKVAEIQKKQSQGQVALPMEVFNFLKDWLLNHIGKSDKQYGIYLNAKGVF